MHAGDAMLGRLLSGRPATARATADPARRGRDRALLRAAVAIGLALLLLLGVLAFEAERAVPVPPAAVPAIAPVETAPPSPAPTMMDRPPPVSEAPPPAAAAGAPPAVEVPPPPSAATVPSPSAPSVALPPAVPLGDGYLIQLGVFGAQANAESLRAELAARGLPAHIESRVVLGPFSSREAAEAAQVRLRRDGKAEGLIVPPRKSK
jgi:DedD protein